MKTRYSLLPLLLLLVSGSLLTAQENGTGLERQPDDLRRALPLASPNGLVKGEGQLPGDGRVQKPLPESVDLSPWLPAVGMQGMIGSCSAWSTVYYSKTLQENRERGWGADDPHEIFSPLFTYNQIARGRNEGTAIVDHMALVVEQGCATLATFPELYDLKARPGPKARDEALAYRADSYESLDTWNERTGTWQVDLNRIKILLAAGYPVVVGFTIFEDFESYRGGVYSRPRGQEIGGHAMCIVGYDDGKKALKIINSWGSEWGDNGFFWLSYALFPRVAQWGAAVLYDSRENTAGAAFPPTVTEATQGTYLGKIKLTWSGVAGAREYIIYKSDNASGTLVETARTKTTEFLDDPLPEGVHYLYAVRSVNAAGAESDLSPVAEGWTGVTAADGSPGIPAGLECYFNGKIAVFTWDEVDQAEGYYLYRWEATAGEWQIYGESRDGVFIDRRYLRINKDPVTYFIVSSWNEGGESYATTYLTVSTDTAPKIRPDGERLASTGSPDDRSEPMSGRTYAGDFYTPDYFDYQFVMKQFRAFYEAEQKAFAEWKQRERDDFEAWKKKRDTVQ